MAGELVTEITRRALQEIHAAREDLGRRKSEGSGRRYTMIHAEKTDRAARTESTETEASEQTIAAFLARLPRRSPSDLVALARQQGKSPVMRFEDLLGEEVPDEDDFDVDAFLAAREQWQSEERRLDGREAVRCASLHVGA